MQSHRPVAPYFDAQSESAYEETIEALHLRIDAVEQGLCAALYAKEDGFDSIESMLNLTRELIDDTESAFYQLKILMIPFENPVKTTVADRETMLNQLKAFERQFTALQKKGYQVINSQLLPKAESFIADQLPADKVSLVNSFTTFRVPATRVVSSPSLTSENTSSALKK